MTTPLFHSLPCLSSEGSVLTTPELMQGSFREQLDKRYVIQALSKLITYNRRGLDFLSVTPLIEGLDPNPSLRLFSGTYVGAIPLRMPGTGKQGGDLLVYPRFERRGQAFAQLTKLMAALDEVIRPEYLPSLPLASGTLVRPPLYYDALKYIDLFDLAARKPWLKFRVEQAVRNYPKSGTDWRAYALASYRPEQALRYPVRESVLSPDHRDWQRLKFVLTLAMEELLKPSTPRDISLPGLRKAEDLLSRTRDIPLLPCDSIPQRFVDPQAIRRLKAQAVPLLRQEGSLVTAWRMDIALLFERYVQHLLKQAVAALPARFIANPRFMGRGAIPAWGLRQLEPDALVIQDQRMIAIDAKYKAHYLNQRQPSALMTESHRADLHQLLAYCSFSGRGDRQGILVYPSQHPAHQRLSYNNHYLGQTNRLLLLGLPFDADSMAGNREYLRGLLGEMLRTSDEGEA